MKLKVYDIEGQETGQEVDLSPEVFETEVNEHAVYLAVKQYLAAQRQGTHKAKERAEIKGSTKKIKRQKGTGTARAGSIKSPIFKGGGRIFGPRPRNYDFKLNKKVKATAVKSALSQKVQDGTLVVVEDFTFDGPKTKSYAQILKNFELDGKRSTLVTGDKDVNVYLSARNLPKAGITTSAMANTYEIMNCNKLLMTVSAVSSLEERLK